MRRSIVMLIVDNLAGQGARLLNDLTSEPGRFLRQQAFNLLPILPGLWASYTQ
ncbi:MAG: hypothetical protein ACTXOO_04700 [Sodalis sp. (in: enterobacteria)]